LADRNTVIESNEDLKVFSEFFAVDTQKKADYFMRKYSNNELAMNLIYEYNKASSANVSDKGDVYMTDRTIKSWKDIAAITAEEINARNKQEIKENQIRLIRNMLKRNEDLETMCEYTGMTKSELFQFCDEENIDLIQLDDSTHHFE
jgi:hypothetical protein